MSSTLTDLTAATTWSGTDLFYALVGGNSRKIAASKFLVGEAAGVLAQVDSTTAQTFRLYRTFTDSSNYERLALQSASGYFEIRPESAGTGTDNINLRLNGGGSGNVEIINGTGTVPLTVTQAAASSFTPGISVLCSGLSSGQAIYSTIGRSATAGNEATWGFTWVGDNDSTNSMDFWFNGSSPVISAQKGGQLSIFKNLATPAGGSTSARLVMGTTAGFGIYIGSGAPSVSAAQGSLYLRNDGSSTSTRLYVNTTGSTTWTNVTTAA